MVDTVAEFQQVFLTYKDVAEANPDWSDSMVEDYLSTKRDITTATETADNAVNTSSAAVLVPALIKRLDSIEKMRRPNYGQIALGQIASLSFKSVNISADFTTNGNQFITTTNAFGVDISVTLNVTPKDLEEIEIKRAGSGRVNFIGNIDGNTNEYIASVGDGIHLRYSISLGYWVAI